MAAQDADAAADDAAADAADAADSTNAGADEDESKAPATAATPAPETGTPPAPPASGAGAPAVPPGEGGEGDAASDAVASDAAAADDLSSGPPSRAGSVAMSDGHSDDEDAQAPWRLVGRQELLDMLETRFGGLRELETSPPQVADLKKRVRFADPEAGEQDADQLVCGMIGYPNVGKSSTINVLMGVTAATHGVTRVAVGSTPGKTKHFQVRVVSTGL